VKINKFYHSISTINPELLNWNTLIKCLISSQHLFLFYVGAYVVQLGLVVYYLWRRNSSFMKRGQLFAPPKEDTSQVNLLSLQQKAPKPKKEKDPLYKASPDGLKNNQAK
jgi:hypothetical protein